MGGGVDSPLSGTTDGLSAQTRVRLRFHQADDAVKEARVPAGTTLFDAASWNGVAIDSTCGGHGTCKKCKVRVVSGAAEISPVDPRAFSVEELKSGWRLACRAAAQEDLTVEVPELQTRPKAALAGVGRHVILRPAVQKRYVELVEPTLHDQRSDLERLLDAMDDVEPRVPLDVVRAMGRTLRESDWKVTAVLADDVLIAVEPGDTSTSRHAIAFDLGTTTVVATLLDLETGQPKAVRSVLNAQQPFGADVISRISATMMDDDALARLQSHAHETLQQLAGEVCAEAGVDLREVYEVVVTGNQTMIQLALGIDPEPLSMAPFAIA
ncbi:MAG: 2Fe-2S iron-sulfur cluster binding domain-containing protein, partial [Acidobacteriota bacterium]|nr:2Fe-2S iron-sulfur cluster binding domain-containing protein [Acidobacteriota bacterium]